MIHDTKIYRKIATENDCVELQKDLDILQEWSNKWLLSFNAKKCKVMRLGGQHPEFIYKMTNNTDVIFLYLSTGCFMEFSLLSLGLS